MSHLRAGDLDESRLAYRSRGLSHHEWKSDFSPKRYEGEPSGQKMWDSPAFCSAARETELKKRRRGKEEQAGNDKYNTAFCVCGLESEWDIAGGREAPECETLPPGLLKRGRCGSMPWAHMCVCVCVQKSYSVTPTETNEISDTSLPL